MGNEPKRRTFYVGDDDWEALRSKCKAAGYPTRGAWFKEELADFLGGGSVNGNTAVAATVATPQAAGGHWDAVPVAGVAAVVEMCFKPGAAKASDDPYHSPEPPRTASCEPLGLPEEPEPPPPRWRLDPKGTPLDLGDEFWELPLCKDSAGKVADSDGKVVPRQVAALIEKMVDKGRMAWVDA